MTDQQSPSRNPALDEPSPFDALLTEGSRPTGGTSFATVFRGYDRDEVDAALTRLHERARADADEIASLEERYRHVSEAAATQARDAVAGIEAERDAANARAAEVDDRVSAAEAAAQEQARAEVERLEAELAATNARLAQAEQRAQVLTEEFVEGESAGRGHFEEVLRVAEEQASLLIRNASIQADRLLEASREEIASRRAEAQVEADAIVARAEHDAQQARLRIQTELTAHDAQLEREGAHAAEKVAQAEREAATIRTEAEKGAAALRSMVARETSLQRTEAEEAVRELRMRALEFEESLTRRQDDAQQEFLVLHNQAVAHAERITQDANEQVAASVEHAQRVAAKADDFDRLMRAQAQQVEADAKIRAREHVDRARDKAQKIIDTVTGHADAALRDAEDRTRQLRWQQHQLVSFMAEVKELIRPEAPRAGAAELTVDASAEEADAEPGDTDAVFVEEQPEQ